MHRISFLIAALASSCAINAFAQNKSPVVFAPIQNLTLYGGAPARSIDLSAAIQDADL